ncbi:MAG TPA: alpha/beta hydrolase [Solirubrobacteraceae bacterium]
MRGLRPAAGSVAAMIACALLLAQPASGRTLRLGALALHPCGDGSPGWCGALRRPLDPARPRGTSIAVGLRWLAAAHPQAGAPPLLAVEGGPGYPSTGSQVEYTGIYGTLLRTRNLLLVDNRGTGTSGLIDCRRLQAYTGTTSGAAFERVVAGCAAQIDHGYPRVRQASGLFSTAPAVDDLAAVLRALAIPKVDLYGDSYGTWFAQSFMARHGGLLDSVVLDSAYPVRGLDPWYASSGVAARNALDAVCARDVACAAAAPGSASARLARLLGDLRRGPLTGPTRDADGSRVQARIDVHALVDMVQDAGSDPVIYRELDASVRAALAGDRAPLLRLAAQSHTFDHGTSPAGYFSDGLYMAVACADYPQLFSMRSAPARRRAQFAARVPGAPAADFAPFAVGEWLGVSAYTQPYRACLDWPRPVRRIPVVPATASPLPASVPVLVIGGDLDSLTPLSDARAAAPALARTVRVVTLANTVHVTSEGDTMLTAGATCARRIIRGFVRAPQRLASLDTTCAAAIPPVHTPGAYPLRLNSEAAATVTSGPDPGLTARRAVTAAAGALADATVRRFYSGVAHGPGLRGGGFATSGERVIHFALHRVQFVGDAAIDGTATWTPATGRVSGELTVRPSSGPAVHVGLRWTQAGPVGFARTGATNLTLPAP